MYWKIKRKKEQRTIEERNIPNCFIPLHTHVTCLDMKTMRGESFIEKGVAYSLDLVSIIARWSLIL